MFLYLYFEDHLKSSRTSSKIFLKTHILMLMLWIFKSSKYGKTGLLPKILFLFINSKSVITFLFLPCSFVNRCTCFFSAFFVLLVYLLCPLLCLWQLGQSAWPIGSTQCLLNEWMKWTEILYCVSHSDENSVKPGLEEENFLFFSHSLLFYGFVVT